MNLFLVYVRREANQLIYYRRPSKAPTAFRSNNIMTNRRMRKKTLKRSCRSQAGPLWREKFTSWGSFGRYRKPHPDPITAEIRRRKSEPVSHHQASAETHHSALVAAENRHNSEYDFFICRESNISSTVKRKSEREEQQVEDDDMD
jgi:hypothetical protein